jgi:hypothetical protein
MTIGTVHCLPNGDNMPFWKRPNDSPRSAETTPLPSEAVLQAALADSVGQIVPWVEELIENREGHEMIARLAIQRLREDEGVDAEWSERLGLTNPAPAVPTADECLSRLEAVFREGSPRNSESPPPRLEELVEDYRAMYRFGLANVLAQVVVGSYPESADHEGYKILASAGLLPPQWEEAAD